MVINKPVVNNAIVSDITEKSVCLFDKMIKIQESLENGEEVEFVSYQGETENGIKITSCFLKDRVITFFTNTLTEELEISAMIISEEDRTFYTDRNQYDFLFWDTWIYGHTCLGLRARIANAKEVISRDLTKLAISLRREKSEELELVIDFQQESMQYELHKMNSKKALPINVDDLLDFFTKIAGLERFSDAKKFVNRPITH